MFERVELIGHLGRDPQMQYLPDGRAYTRFSLATTRRWKGQGGVEKEATTWWQVTAWGKLGEICNQYLRRGARVLVVGRMAPDPQTGQPRIWTGQDGQPRASYELTAQKVLFLDRRPVGETAAATAPQAAEPFNEDEIPF